MQSILLTSMLQQQISMKKNGLEFSDGTNKIIFTKEGVTLNWENADESVTQAIFTTDGSTNINFNTSGGKTTIAMGDGKVGEVETITTSGAELRRLTSLTALKHLKVQLAQQMELQQSMWEAIMEYYDERSDHDNFKTLTIGEKKLKIKVFLEMD